MNAENKQSLIAELLTKEGDLFASSKYQDALDVADEILKIDPKNVVALSIKGVALRELGKYQEAVEILEEALKIDPKYTYALNNKGVALNNLDKYQEAIELYDEVLKIDPKYTYALNNKGHALRSLLKQRERELEEYKRFFKNIAPLLDKLDVNPELVRAIIDGMVDDKLAKAIIDGRITILEELETVDYNHTKEADSAPDEIQEEQQEEVPKDNSSATLDEFLENDPILKKLELNSEKKEALKIILDNKNTLVTARAGTGKSTLLCALIYILIKKYNINKNNILLLSFNASVRKKNIKDLKEKLGIRDFFGTHTFDSLAYQIVKTPGKVLDVLTGLKLTDIISDIIKKQSIFYRLKYWWYLGELDKEYKVDAKIHTSFLGEDLKSYGEKSIANFLFEHGLDYEYEPVMQWGENQYRPDFLITQGSLKVVVEYFGFTDPEYLQQAKRKREYWGKRDDCGFVEMGIENFGGEKNNPEKFLGTLKKNLEYAGLTLEMLSDEKKAEKIFQSKTRLKKIAKVTLDFINFAQAQCLLPNDIVNRLEDKNYISILTKKNKFFSEFANNVYEKFIENLNENSLYDFFKVKKSAVDIILSTGGECSMNFGPNKDVKVKNKDLEWVLIDEFQDYSPAYHELIDAIKQTNHYVKFVCVGDDWQAINGFAGSDIKYMSEYKNNFSDEDIVRVNLTTNFRSKKEIVDMGNNLMEGLGIKAVAENKDDTTCGWFYSRVIGRNTDLKISYYLGTIRKIISDFKYINENITILHRNNKMFGVNLDDFLIELKKGSRVANNIKISTIHQYKGEEDDIIIFINVTNFNHPLMHQDRSMHYVLGLTDKKIIDEERRLFYVAMTRAKKAVHIVTDENHSPFIVDLKDKAHVAE